MTVYDATMMVDVYKLDHRRMYPEGTQLVYSNITARGSRIKGIDEIVVFGVQGAWNEIIEAWENTFFSQDIEKICTKYTRRMNQLLGPDNKVGTQHLRDLHAYGSLPIDVYCLPEGTLCPIKVPFCTIQNSRPDFFWLTNYLETVLSAKTWKAITNATIAYRFRKLLNSWAVKTTGSTQGVDFQGHDFSMRGMGSVETAGVSGAAHLLSFAGTDVCPALDYIEQNYPLDNEDTLIGCSVPATEHSVMCCGGKDTEIETFQRLMELYPTGILSVVSDTWDLWKVITDTLPKLREEILGRDGTLVIRPDSGDPVDIICGKPGAEGPEGKGVVELLWDLFGGTYNDMGYIELDSHIGAIYGDSINFERAEQICQRLQAKGFASTNIVLGIGSFTYQYNTRDTFGMAVKATYCRIGDEGFEIFKDPVTDDGVKKSAKGLLMVLRDENGKLYLKDQCTEQEWGSVVSCCLKPLVENGKLINQDSWETVVKRVGVRNV